MNSISGHCLCKSIRFKILSECRKSVFCHCSMCQRSNSEFSLYTKVKIENFKISKNLSLKWFFSSKKYKRGFCSRCGSSLFFKQREKPTHVAISTGCLNKAIPIAGHIYYQDKKMKIPLYKNLKKFHKSHRGFFDKFKFKI